MCRKHRSGCFSRAGPNDEEEMMSNELAGKTITVTTKKSLSVDEISELVRNVFGATGCQGCTSGGNFVLREAVELPLDAASNATAVISG